MIFVLLLSLLPDKPLPAYLPGDDVVIWSKYGDGVYQTLEGKQAVVTDVSWNKYTRRIDYVLNTEAWGNFERASTNIVTRRQWGVMSEEFMRWHYYPSWWMPLVEGKDGPR